MNYNEMLKTNIFNFSKHLLYNALMAFCIVVMGALLIVHFSNCAIYDVLSDSQLPVFKSGDLIVVKPAMEYVVGDIVKFYDKNTTLDITHRIIGVKIENKNVYYVCHGDNEQSVESYASNKNKVITEWKNNAQYVEKCHVSELKNYTAILQIVEKKYVEGKVVAKISNAGTVLKYVKNNSLYIVILFIVVFVYNSNKGCRNLYNKFFKKESV